MKKTIMGLLIASSILLVGCNGASVADSVDIQNPEEETTSIEVEKEIFDVQLTIPADLVGEITQDELDQICEEKGYESATLNADGSVTYVMSRSQHKELMNQTKETIEQGLDDIVNSDDYPTITKIDTNSDYTKFTITTTSTELNLIESITVLQFYMYGGMYNSFNGTPADDVETIWINADSGEEIAHTSLKAAMEQQNN